MLNRIDLIGRLVREAEYRQEDCGKNGMDCCDCMEMEEMRDENS